MGLKFGEAIYMGSRMHPVKAHIVPIANYPLKYKIVSLSNTPKEYKIECFNLDEFRKNKAINNMNKIELE